MYLAEMHCPQVVPESLLLSKGPEKPSPEENDGRFVSLLGDPVYYEASVPAWAWARAGPDRTLAGPAPRNRPLAGGSQS